MASWGKQPHRLLSLAEAWEIIAREVRPIGVEEVPLAEAEGRILAQPVHACDDYPAFDKAMMDGYAVRSADCSAAGARLRVRGLVAAGVESIEGIEPGCAVRINTGAPIPPGADAVVRVEDTKTLADGGGVEIGVIARPGLNITRRGCDRRAGDAVLSPPLRLGPAQIAAAATAGAARVTAGRLVTAAIVTTGNELVPVGADRRPGQIFESNGPMLAGLLRQFGATPRRPVIARDEIGALESALAAALEDPIVIAAGGMSMGTLDLVPQALETLGVRWQFHGVEMRPGKPVAYGRGPNGQHVFGLPGNPVSSFVCAWLFVRMVVRGMQGFATEPPTTIRATLACDVKPAKDARPAYVPARVWSDTERGLLVEPAEWGGSSDPFGLALGNGLLVRTEPGRHLAAGSAVEVILTDTDSL